MPGLQVYPLANLGLLVLVNGVKKISLIFVTFFAISNDLGSFIYKVYEVKEPYPLKKEYGQSIFLFGDRHKEKFLHQDESHEATKEYSIEGAKQAVELADILGYLRKVEPDVPIVALSERKVSKLLAVRLGGMDNVGVAFEIALGENNALKIDSLRPFVRFLDDEFGVRIKFPNYDWLKSTEAFFRFSSLVKTKINELEKLIGIFSRIKKDIFYTKLENTVLEVCKERVNLWRKIENILHEVLRNKIKRSLREEMGLPDDNVVDEKSPDYESKFKDKLKTLVAGKDKTSMESVWDGESELKNKILEMIKPLANINDKVTIKNSSVFDLTILYYLLTRKSFAPRAKVLFHGGRNHGGRLKNIFGQMMPDYKVALVASMDPKDLKNLSANNDVFLKSVRNSLLGDKIADFSNYISNEIFRTSSLLPMMALQREVFKNLFGGRINVSREVTALPGDWWQESVVLGKGAQDISSEILNSIVEKLLQKESIKNIEDEKLKKEIINFELINHYT